MTKATEHKPYRDHEEALIESLRKDPAFATEYLNAVLEDGGEQELMMALRRVAEAFGGVPQLAKATKLHVKTLYRTLSPQGNPELRSLTAMLKAMGMRIAVLPIPSPMKVTRRRRVQKVA